MKIVKVEWLDATGGERKGWRGIKDVKSLEPARVVSVGYLLAESKDTVLVCPHMTLTDSGEPEDGDAEIAIPRTWVKKIKVLSR